VRRGKSLIRRFNRKERKGRIARTPISHLPVPRLCRNCHFEGSREISSWYVAENTRSLAAVGMTDVGYLRNSTRPRRGGGNRRGMEPLKRLEQMERILLLKEL